MGPARVASMILGATLAISCGRKDREPDAAAAPPQRVVSGVAYAATAPRHDVEMARGTALAPVDLWLQQLASSDLPTRQAAAVSLGLAGAAGRDAVAPLTDMLDDADPRSRLLAAQALGRIGPDALSAVTRLQALAADDADVDVKAAASTAIALLQPPLDAARASQPPLIPVSGVEPAQSLTPPEQPPIPLVDDRGDLAQVQAMREATAFGTLTQPAVDDLVRNLRDESPAVRRDAAMRLGVIGSRSPARVGNPATIGRVPPPAAFGPEAENAIARLGDVVVEDEDADVRLAAATALARIGAPADGAQSDLEQAAAHDADPGVRLAATQALTQIRRRY